MFKAYKYRLYPLSGTDRKNHGELPTLVGALTHEAQPIALGVGGQFTDGFNEDFDGEELFAYEHIAVDILNNYPQ